jgi:hypothetical protein
LPRHGQSGRRRHKPFGFPLLHTLRPQNGPTFVGFCSVRKTPAHAASFRTSKGHKKPVAGPAEGRSQSRLLRGSLLCPRPNPCRRRPGWTVATRGFGRRRRPLPPHRPLFPDRTTTGSAGAAGAGNRPVNGRSGPRRLDQLVCQLVTPERSGVAKPGGFIHR